MRRLLPALAVLASGACAQLPTPRVTDAMAFSSLAEGSAVPPPGWRPLLINPAKKRTDYRLVNLDGRVVLEASADRSASGLMHPLTDAKAGRLDFSLKVDHAPAGASVGDRHGEDAAARIIVAFDGDAAMLPLVDRLFMERASLLSGRPFPYATLMYVIDDSLPPGSVVPSPHSGRIRKIVISGSEAVRGRWTPFERDLQADYRQAFGEAPGRLLGVGLMTDADNTQSRAKAWYGDIRLRP